MTDYQITELEKDDYYRGFLRLLEQLTTVNVDDITYDQFLNQLDKIKSKVFVIRHDNQIIGTSSVFIEPKFIRKLSHVGHIEDVVVEKNYRGKGLGKMLLNHCLRYAKDQNCYKVILNCENKNIKFYEKCGFINKNVEMCQYL